MKPFLISIPVKQGADLYGIWGSAKRLVDNWQKGSGDTAITFAVTAGFDPEKGLPIAMISGMVEQKRAPQLYDDEPLAMATLTSLAEFVSQRLPADFDEFGTPRRRVKIAHSYTFAEFTCEDPVPA